MKLSGLVFGLIIFSLLISGCISEEDIFVNGGNDGAVISENVTNSNSDSLVNVILETDETAAEDFESEGDKFFEKIGNLKNIKEFSLERTVKLKLGNEEKYNKKQIIEKKGNLIKIEEEDTKWYLEDIVVECKSGCVESSLSPVHFNRFFDNERIFSFLRGLSVSNARDLIVVEKKSESDSYERDCKLYKITADSFSGNLCLDSKNNFIVFARIESEDGSSYYEQINSFSEKVDELTIPEYEKNSSVLIE
ncbi:MAG: hypothetical protein V1672_02030 [Candidatus Diapherotrites archaeon]